MGLLHLALSAASGLVAGAGIVGALRRRRSCSCSCAPPAPASHHGPGVEDAEGAASGTAPGWENDAKLLFADRMTSMGALAAGVAHEINNPLTFVVANLAYAIDALEHHLPPPAEVLRALVEAQEGVQRVRSIVLDLKMFSRSEEGDDGPVDVRRVLQSSANLVANEVKHRARLRLDLDDVPPVVANSHRLGQVFVNLIINATQAIPEGAADRNVIAVRARSSQASVCVEVSDTGCGIADDVLPRIFEPFFTTKPVGVGTGLGLAVCNRIVTRLGGTIDVESRPGAGSTFRVLLPAMAVTRAAG